MWRTRATTCALGKGGEAEHAAARALRGEAPAALRLTPARTRVHAPRVSTDESGFEYEVMDDSLGFERMMRWEDVSNPATGFLRGDALRVSVKIRLLPPAAG